MKTKNLILCITLVSIVLVSTLFVSASGVTLSSNSAQAAASPSTAITGVISAVESGTTGTSSWSVGPIPDPIGTTVNVDIRIDGATPQTIWGWTVNVVNWTASVLQLTKVTQGNFLKDSGDSTLMVGTNPSLWNNTLGTINGGLACSDATSPTAQTTDTSG